MAIKKSPEEVLKEIKAKTKGVSPKDIVFSDGKVRRKNKRKKITEITDKNLTNEFSNKEGIILTNNEVQFCDYRSIPKKKKQFKKKDNIEEWGPFDFFFFAQKLYISKFKKEWNLRVGGNSLVINKIRDKLYDIYGFCCNLIVKDYIEYFFNNFIDDFVNKKGDFYFTQMLYDSIISKFIEQYDFQKSFSDYTSKKKISDRVSSNIGQNDIEEAFLFGDTTLLATYGIVISLNWLIIVKKNTKKEAVQIVINACRKMYKKNMFNVVVKSTEFFSPYPEELIFKSPQLVINKIDPSIQINVCFEKNNKLKYLFNEKGK